MVRGGVLPGLKEGAGLGRKDGLGEQNAFLSQGLAKETKSLS